MVREIVNAQSSDSIRDVSKKIYSKNVGSTVIFKEIEPIRFVTYTDIAVALANFDKSSDLPIMDIISTTLVHVGPEESILKVAEMMVKSNIHHVLIMKNNDILGIISSGDIVVILTMLEEEHLFEKFKPYFRSQG